MGSSRRRLSRCAPSWFGAAGATVLVLLASAQPAAAQTPPSITADELVARLRSGEPVEEVGLHVVGQLDLRPLGEVKQSLRCQNCVIEGGVIATDVVFDRSVDLDGVRIEGDVDLRSTLFRGPVLLRAGGVDNGITGAIDASFATFADTAGFDGLRFGGPAKFTGARFAGGASFSGSTFAGPASFDQARFDGLASFNGLRERSADVARAHFEDQVTFRGAVFAQAADLALRVYDADLDISNTVFAGGMSVSRSDVLGDLQAQGAALAALDARALVVSGEADLVQVRAASAALDSAIFQGPLRLDEMTVTGATSLRGVTLAGALSLKSFLSSKLEMDLDLVRRVVSTKDQEAALALIETTERAQGDNGTANDAEYRLRALEGDAKHGLPAMLDLGFYRGAAGYLVRPLHPFATMALLLVAGTVARFVNDRRRDHPKARHLGNDLNRAGKVTVRVGHVSGTALDCFSRALAGAFRPKPNIQITPDEREDPEAYLVASLRLFEYAAGKALILVFLLSVASYNETLRELIQGVIP